MPKKTPTKVTKKSAVAKRTIPTMGDDFKMALLVVSLIINVLALIAWLFLRVTDDYDTAIAQFFLNR